MKDLRIDEKGKFFTEYVTKIAMPVIIATATNIVKGTIHLTPDNRLKDEMNAGEQFVAITHADIYALDGKTQLYALPTLILNKQQIDWVSPQENRFDASTSNK